MKLVRFAALALLAAASGCADAPTAIPAPTGGPSRHDIVRVDVYCPAWMWVNDVNGCWAAAFDEHGNEYSTTPLWSSSDPYSVSVNGGTVFANAPQGAFIYATVAGVTGWSYISVYYTAVLTSVSVSPTPTTVYTGGSRQLTATAKDQWGYTMSGQTFSWSSSNTAAATVSGSGVVSAVAPGSATITASAGGKSGSASVTVANAPVSTSVSGPSSVARYQSAQYTASASGGTPGYSYQWRTRQGNAYSWGTWQSWFSTGSTNYTYASVSSCGVTRSQIEVLVTDANGGTATSSHAVNISNPC
ncbi:MAG TPA: Ig-like domain-containing protein [Longimicrobium sp.]